MVVNAEAAGRPVAAPIIAAVVPSFRVTDRILDVLAAIGPECSQIWVVDDCCPDGSGRLVAERATDPRVRVIFNERNEGVGGAVIAGYRAALAEGADIIVKIDGDGQMDPRLVPALIAPLLRGEADYAKGNRFYSVHNVRTMPRARLLGNAVLSLVTKLSSGYWSVFDPTNGFTAVHAAAVERINLAEVSKRYFFESDMLVKLGGVRAAVIDVPMAAVYRGERSSLRIRSVVPEFLYRHARAFLARILYLYFLRDFSVASLELVWGLLLTAFGVIFGVWHWVVSLQSGITASAGTVLLAALPVLLGVQLLLNFLGYDIANEPRIPLQRIAPPVSKMGAANPGSGTAEPHVAR